MSGMPDSSAGAQAQSLEEYIKATERDHDEEVGKTIRLWEWQDREILIIGIEINTNHVEIVNRAYSIGLQKLREDVGDEMEDVNRMMVEFLKATGEVDEDSEDDGEIMSEVKNYQIEFSNTYGELTDPQRFKLKRSELSEVQDRYMTKGPFGGWLHRVITMLGLKESENVTSNGEKIISSVSASLDDEVENARDYLESRIKRFFTINAGRWAQEGIDDGTVGHLEKVVEHMDTKHGDELDSLLDMVDNYDSGGT